MRREMQATIVWVQIKDMNVRAFEIFVFKLTFLLSFCGGPLFVADLLKSMLGTDIAFLTAFLPVGVAGVCVYSLWESHPWNWGKRAVFAGALGVMVISVMNALTIWQLVIGPERPDRSLIIVGIVVGMASSTAYTYLARRRLRS